MPLFDYQYKRHCDRKNESETFISQLKWKALINTSETMCVCGCLQTRGSAVNEKTLGKACEAC